MTTTKILVLSAAGAAAATGALVAWIQSRSRPQFSSRFQTSAAASLPILVGTLVGLLILLPSAAIIATNDRFYDADTAFVTILGLTATTLLLTSYASAFLDAKALPIALNTAPQPNGMRRMAILLALQVSIGFFMAANDIQFAILSIWPGREIQLGMWSAPLTALWIVLAANALRLLDGLNGTLPLLVAGTALATGWLNLPNQERVLTAIAAVMAGAALGAFPWHVHRARIILRGDATACVGTLLAIFTILARQKTVATLGVLLPLAVVAIFLGIAMMGIMERILQPGATDSEDRP